MDLKRPTPLMSHRTTHIKDLNIGALSVYDSTDTPVIELTLAYVGSEHQVFVFPIEKIDSLKIDKWFINPDNKSCHICNTHQDRLVKLDLGDSVYQLFLCVDCLERLLKDINEVENEDMVSAII